MSEQANGCKIVTAFKNQPVKKIVQFKLDKFHDNL